jgi:hypothetical protein
VRSAARRCGSRRNDHEQRFASDSGTSELRSDKKAMKRATLFVSTVLLLFTKFSVADAPTGFSWVNLESDKATMTVVRHALHDTSISAIREVGVEDGFALVMTASRETGAPTPDYDLWSIYNISLTTGKSRPLVSGYGVKIVDWIGVAKDELAVTYYDCWECEAVRSSQPYALREAPDGGRGGPIRLRISPTHNQEQWC